MSGSNVSSAEQQECHRRNEPDVQSDMVVHVEIKVKGVWMHFGCVELAQDDDLFTRMLRRPIGIPRDATDLTWAHFESSQPAASGEDPNPIRFCSPSWLGFEGICDLYEWGCEVMGWAREDDTNYGGWIEDKFGRLFRHFGLNVQHCFTGIDPLCYEMENVRFVFWLSRIGFDA